MRFRWPPAILAIFHIRHCSNSKGYPGDNLVAIGCICYWYLCAQSLNVQVCQFAQYTNAHRALATLHWCIGRRHKENKTRTFEFNVRFESYILCHLLSLKEEYQNRHGYSCLCIRKRKLCEEPLTDTFVLKDRPVWHPTWFANNTDKNRRFNY